MMDGASPVIPSGAHPSGAASSNGGTRGQHTAMGVLALALVLLGVYTLQNFLSALAWAAIFAIALWPLYQRTLSRAGVGHNSIVFPALFTTAVALIFIVPLVLVGVQLADEVHGASEWARTAEEKGIPEPEMLRHMPFGKTQVDGWWQQNLADPGQARDLLERTTRGRVGETSRVIGAQVARRATLFVFTLFTLFFLFREGHEVTQQTRRAAKRAFGPGGERVGRQIIASVHGTVNGLVLVGLGEGLLLGIVICDRRGAASHRVRSADGHCGDDPIRRSRGIRRCGPAPAVSWLHRLGHHRIGDRHAGDLHRRSFRPSGADRRGHEIAVHLGVAWHPRRR